MSKTIAGVPEKITRADYIKLIESIGINPNHCRSLRFEMDGIYAEVMATNENGQHLIIANKSEAAYHSIFVQVVDD